MGYGNPKTGGLRARARGRAGTGAEKRRGARKRRRARAGAGLGLLQRSLQDLVFSNQGLVGGSYLVIVRVGFLELLLELPGCVGQGIVFLLGLFEVGSEASDLLVELADVSAVVVA